MITGSYGEAGALDRARRGAERLNRSDGASPDRTGDPPDRPVPYSGHNSYWHWRRPTDDHATVIAVRMSEAFLARHFDDCELAATIEVPFGIDNEVAGQPIWLCRGLRGTWNQAWHDFRHYN
ncbi:MAG: hypothetical protein R3343_10105 [Nitriliruptorales bacterium]|nr:hypothetical protein [Nitriliruptorales bacterium]